MYQNVLKAHVLNKNIVVVLINWTIVVTTSIIKQQLVEVGKPYSTHI